MTVVCFTSVTLGGGNIAAQAVSRWGYGARSVANAKTSDGAVGVASLREKRVRGTSFGASFSFPPAQSLPVVQQQLAHVNDVRAATSLFRSTGHFMSRTLKSVVDF